MQDCLCQAMQPCDQASVWAGSLHPTMPWCHRPRLPRRSQAGVQWCPREAVWDCWEGGVQRCSKKWVLWRLPEAVSHLPQGGMQGRPQAPVCAGRYDLWYSWTQLNSFTYISKLFFIYLIKHAYFFDQVPKVSCQELNRQSCSEVPKKDCQQKARRVCNLVPKISTKEVSERKCSTHQKNVCQPVTKEVNLAYLNILPKIFFPE